MCVGGLLRLCATAVEGAAGLECVCGGAAAVVCATAIEGVTGLECVCGGCCGCVCCCCCCVHVHVLSPLCVLLLGVCTCM